MAPDPPLQPLNHHSSPPLLQITTSYPILNPRTKPFQPSLSSAENSDELSRRERSRTRNQSRSRRGIPADRSVFRSSKQALSLSFGERGGRNEKLAKHGSSQRGRSRSRFSSLSSKPPENTSLIHYPPLITLVAGSDTLGVSPNLGNAALDSPCLGFFKEPKRIRPDKVLSFCPPPRGQNEIPLVTIPDEVVDRESRRWEDCLVAYVIGKRPPFPTMLACLTAQWKPAGQLQMYSFARGFFLLKLCSVKDKERALFEGPWIFFGWPIVLKEWSQNLIIKKDLFNALPIWIRLPDLDLCLWDKEAIGRIAYVIGHPRFLDDATADRTRIDFARVCVEVEPNCKFPTSINIAMAGRCLEQPIHYKWKPPACALCNTFEHDSSKCTKLDKVRPAREAEEIEKDKEWQLKSCRKQDSRLGKLPEGNTQANLNLNLEKVVSTENLVWRQKWQGRTDLTGTPNTFGALQSKETEGSEDNSSLQLVLLRSVDDTTPTETKEIPAAVEIEKILAVEILATEDINDTASEEEEGEWVEDDDRVIGSQETPTESETVRLHAVEKVISSVPKGDGHSSPFQGLNPNQVVGVDNRASDTDLDASSDELSGDAELSPPGFTPTRKKLQLSGS